MSDDGSWDPQWRAILQHLLGVDGDPFTEEVVSYGGSLNRLSAEPYETLAILRSNAYEALRQYEMGTEVVSQSWEEWAFLELERWHLAERVQMLRRSTDAGISRLGFLRLCAIVGIAWLLVGVLGGYGQQLAAVIGVMALLYMVFDIGHGAFEARRIRRLRGTETRFASAAQSIRPGTSF